VPRDTPLLAISTQAGTGLDNLLFTAKSTVEAARAQAAAAPEPDETVPIHRLSEGSDAWQIEKDEDTFVISGENIAHFAERTDFSNEEAVQRLRDIMQKQGIMHELVRRGIQPGQVVQFPNGQTLEY